VMVLRRYIEAAENPASPAFWFVMSMGLLVGFVVAYPMNWWLVANHLKHGMMTVRPATANAMPGAMSGMSHSSPMPEGGKARTAAMAEMSMEPGSPRPSIPIMTLISFAVLATGIAIPFLLMR
jgi:hypothetical protein